jgi:hypothetical protein
MDNYYINDLPVSDGDYQINNGLGGTEEAFFKLLTHNNLKIKDRQQLLGLDVNLLKKI